MLLALVIIAAAPPVDVTLFPFTAQLNGTYTQHFGHAASVGVGLSERFRLVATGYVSNPLTATSGLRTELIEKAGYEALPGMLLNAYAGLGIELEPFHVEIEGVEVGFVLSGGLGAASTRIELKPRTDSPPTYGDTGWRMGFAFGGGLRARLNRWLAVRLELQDFLMSTGVSNVNGCSRLDLRTLSSFPLGPPVLSSSCRAETFDGLQDDGDGDPSNDRRRSDDIPIAYAAIRAKRGEVLLHNLQLMVGLAVTF